MYHLSCWWQQQCNLLPPGTHMILKEKMILQYRELTCSWPTSIQIYFFDISLFCFWCSGEDLWLASLLGVEEIRQHLLRRMLIDNFDLTRSES